MHTHDEHCDMLLNLEPSSIRTGATVREHALQYPGRRHREANMFPTITAACLWGGKGHTYDTCECRSPTDCTDTSQWRCRGQDSRNIIRQLGLSHPRILEVHLDDQLGPPRQLPPNAHCFYANILYICCTRITTRPGFGYSTPFAIWRWFISRTLNVK
jgi:hypothetical protein